MFAFENFFVIQSRIGLARLLFSETEHMIVTDDTMAANMYRVGGEKFGNYLICIPARMHVVER